VEFFSSTEPWNNQLSHLENFFGISKLSEQLSKELINMTREAVPGMKRRVDDILAETKKELDHLPRQLG